MQDEEHLIDNLLTHGEKTRGSRFTVTMRTIDALHPSACSTPGCPY